VPEQNNESADDALSAKIGIFGRPLRVLIVDDNPTNRLVAARMLKTSTSRPIRRATAPRRSPPPAGSIMT